MNQWLLICSTFFRHYKFPAFHTVIRIHLISLSCHILVVLPSHFSSMEQMLLLHIGHSDELTMSPVYSVHCTVHIGHIDELPMSPAYSTY